MNFGSLAGDVKINSKKFLAILFLFLSTFSWFFFFYGNYKFSSSVNVGYQVLGFRDTSFVLGEGIFLSFIVAFTIVGSLIGEKYDRRKLLLLWTSLGVLSTFLAWIFQGSAFSLPSVALVGMSFGLAFPLVMAFMSDRTAVEERGRISGIVVFVSFAVALGSTSIASSTSLIGAILLSIVLRSLGFFALILDPCDRREGKKHSWGNILTHRQFGFYILPFLMFMVMSGLLYLIPIPKTPDFDNANSIGNVLHLAGTGILAVVAGFAADKIGRRKPIIVGLVMLGVSAAILGYSLSALTWIVYLAISGFAWGIVIVVYFAVPGDLAFPGSQERFYALGTVVPFVTYIGITGPAKLTGFSLPSNWLTPVLTVVLFLSVIPLAYAAETMPENKILEKQLKEHVKKVRKIVEESKKTV